jgi:hypothetical protein
MKFTKAIELDDFFHTVEECEGEVWLESPNGDRLSLKSLFSRYIAIRDLLSDYGDDLELFCQLSEDECKFYKYFYEHPGVT